MLKTRYQHAQEIRKSYLSNMNNIVIGSRMEIAFTFTDDEGHTWKIPRANKRLNRRLDRCYPRGEAWKWIINIRSFD